MNVNKYMKAWVKELDRSDANEINRVGFKPFGIEYRIMVGGTMGGSSNLSPEAQICDMAISELRQHGRKMEFLIKFYRVGSVRECARAHNMSRAQCNRHIDAEKFLLEGAIIGLLNNNSIKKLT